MKKTILMLFLLVVSFLSRAQRAPAEGEGSMIGIKSSILYWAIATFNLRAEVYLARYWTFELKAGLNPFSGKNNDGSYGRPLKRSRLHPESRYWFCETLNGHFLGVRAPYLLYNVTDIRRLGTEGERCQGWGAGTDINYGCSWLLSHHWSLETTIGIGYLYLKSDECPCANCNRKQGGIKKHYSGPAQTAINLIYQF